ncbi:DNA-binding protein [Paenibacillus polymyxa]|uniref:DNA-binding protein n=1 Tax=Paenibacillus polymyxa TaxID=1406 RepID=UPI000C9F7BF3|nr:DNA-binding protein [Paenibacillus polymyxa]PNQ85032.1 DNA-binding protein [Paenibacillus polymyxa]UMR35366.1 DNA-binding protein [Paenibacillus polymyxa]WOZ38003.1 DNA-binding protein [Paenibacillus polymyxa]
MEHTPTIRSTIETELKQRRYTFSSFSKISGINRGTFSTMLNSNPPKPISVRQMDLITKALGYPEGWLYELYIDECFHEGKGHWKRIKPFLLRCVELGRKECIQRVLSRLTEDLSYVSTVFEFAEELHKDGKEKESVPFYECVIENERYYHSERLAISQYRLFCYSLTEDLESSLKAAIKFDPFRKSLPENYQLDGLLKLTNVYFNTSNWENAIKYAKELRTSAISVYHQQVYSCSKNRNPDNFNSEKPLVVYYGLGYLLHGNALENQGMYEEALKFIPYYEDLSWFEGLDENGLQGVKMLQLWAKANLLNLKVLIGDVSSLVAYVELLQKNPQEISHGLISIIESANKYNFSLENVLNVFSDEIADYKKFVSAPSHYQISTLLWNYSRLYLELARYYFNTGRYSEAIENIIKSLRVSTQLNTKSTFIKGVTLLFEKLIGHITHEQLTEYEKVLEEVRYGMKQMVP